MFNSTLRIEALKYDVGTSEFYAVLWMGRLEEKNVKKLILLRTQAFYSQCGVPFFFFNTIS